MEKQTEETQDEKTSHIALLEIPEMIEVHDIPEMIEVQEMTIEMNLQL